MKHFLLGMSLFVLASQALAVDTVQKIKLYVPNPVNRKIEDWGKHLSFPLYLTHKNLSGDIPWDGGLESHPIKINGTTYDWVWVNIGSGRILERSALYTTDHSRKLWKVCSLFDNTDPTYNYHWDQKQYAIIFSSRETTR